jgi:hypothetical protein
MINIELNVSSSGLVFVGAVGCKDHARWILASVCLCYGDASVLTVTGDTFPLHDGAYTSWLQWPKGYYKASGIEIRAQPTATWETGELQLRFDTLSLDLLQLTQPPEELSIPSLKKATSVVVYFQDTYPGLFCEMTERPGLRNFKHNPEDFENSDLARQFRSAITYLAAGLDNGAQWITDAFPAERQRNWPAEALADAFRLLLPNHDLDAFSGQLEVALVNIMYAAFRQRWWRQTHTISVGSSGSRGILSELDEASEPGTILAIPSLLANMSCEGTARLWLLQKTNFEGEAWKVVYKGFIFGCGVIEVNGREVKILRNVPIVVPS